MHPFSLRPLFGLLLLAAPVLPAAGDSFVSAGVPFHNGLPRFNVGYYDGIAAGQAEKLELIERMGEGGFNTALIPPRGDGLAQTREYLNLAVDLGVGVVPLFDVGNDNPSFAAFHRDRLRDTKDISSVYLVNVLDDMYNHLPSDLAATSAVARGIAPEHATFASGNTSNYFYGNRAAGGRNKREPRGYLGAADAFEVQAYVIARRSRNSPTLTGPEAVWDIVPRGVNQAQGKTPVFAVLQTYDLNEDPLLPDSRGGEVPTSTDMDLMSWASVIAGVQGVHYYNLRNPGSRVVLPDDEPRDVAIWDATTRFAREVLGTELWKAFLFGVHEKRLIRRGLFVGTWDYNGKLYLVAANATDASRSIDARIQTNTLGQPEPLFPDRPDRLRIQDDRLTGTLAPGDVSVYSVPVEDAPNALVNGGFEDAFGFGGSVGVGGGWELLPSSTGRIERQAVEGGARIEGSTRLETAGAGVLRQVVELPNGRYLLRARSHSNPVSRSKLVVTGFRRNFEEFQQEVAVGGDQGWPAMQVSVQEILVNNGRIQVRYEVDDRGTWSILDDVQIVPYPSS